MPGYGYGMMRSQSTAEWERIMAEASKNSWKDEWLTIVFSIPLILVFIPSMVEHIQAGFTALATLQLGIMRYSW